MALRRRTSVRWSCWKHAAVGIDAMVVVDVTGQVAFGEELQGWLEGEMLEIGSFAIIVDGNDWYLSGEVVDGLVEPGTWLQVDVSAAPPGFGELQGSFEVGSDAALALYWLLGADGPIEVLGTESLGGTEVIHVAMPIDLELVRDQLPRWLLPVYGRTWPGCARPAPTSTAPKRGLMTMASSDVSRTTCRSRSAMSWDC